MKILATSDTHGYLPEIPECDILLIGGDVCPMSSHDISFQLEWLDGPFRCWLNEIPAQYILGIAGNHDFVFEQNPAGMAELHLPWIYLQDQSITFTEEIHGFGPLKIYGLPWVPNLPTWAFYATREQLDLRYSAIPKDTDIILAHGPPFTFGDYSIMGHLNVGSKVALNTLGRVKPQAYVCGHIHEGRGMYRFTGQHDALVEIYNVSYVSVDYQPYPLAEPIVEILLDDDIMIDNAAEEQTEPEQSVHHSDADTRSPSEPSA